MVRWSGVELIFFGGLFSRITTWPPPTQCEMVGKESMCEERPSLCKPSTTSSGASLGQIIVSSRIWTQDVEMWESWGQTPIIFYTGPEKPPYQWKNWFYLLRYFSWVLVIMTTTNMLLLGGTRINKVVWLFWRVQKYGLNNNVIEIQPNCLLHFTHISIYFFLCSKGTFTT